MKRLSLTQWCQMYLLLALLVATVLSPMPYPPLALGLLLVILLVSFRPLPPRLNVAIMVMIIFLLPLMLESLLNYLTRAWSLPPFTPQFVAVATILPAIYLLDDSLKQNALAITPAHNITGRGITHVTKSVAVSISVLLLISLILDYDILLFTSLTMAVYWLINLARAFQALPRPPVDIPTVPKRIVAGATADVSVYATSRAAVRLHCRLSPVDPWVNITPQRFSLDGGRIELNLAITPPLAGPSYPHLQVSAIDHRGLIQVNHIAQPVELHVIPRARYAEWLATKYLGQSGSRLTTTLSPQGAQIPKSGTEYYSSRTFQFGDALSSIDWRHTLKARRLIIKEYTEAGKQAAIIAVNLSVTDAEEADKLALNLITTGLTLARQAIPTALAAYNHEKVILTTGLTDPKEILKQTLRLVKEIHLAELAHRCLQPEAMGRLRRNITYLKQSTSEPAQRLLNMLDFEYRAIEQAARNHTATAAIKQVVRRISPPAIIVLVSQMSHDAEALLVTTDRLARQGFSTLRVEGGAKF